MLSKKLSNDVIGGNKKLKGPEGGFILFQQGQVRERKKELDLMVPVGLNNITVLQFYF